jgi:hypothetical protein
LGGMMASSINDSTVDIMKRIMEGDLAHHVWDEKERNESKMLDFHFCSYNSQSMLSSWD